MSECGAASVPELVHPGCRAVQPGRAVSVRRRPGQRLDAVAVEAQSTEAKSAPRPATDNARRAALKNPAQGAKEGVEPARRGAVPPGQDRRGIVPPSASRPQTALEKLGLERRDAAVIAVLLADQSAASGDGGPDQGSQPAGGGPADGRPRQPALNLTAGSDASYGGAQASERRPGAPWPSCWREAGRAVQKPDEGRAAALLREAAARSAPRTPRPSARRCRWPRRRARARSTTGTRSSCSGSLRPGMTMVRRTWYPDRAAATGRSRRRHRSCTAGRAVSCADTHAPVASRAQYGIFAVADGRPGSRPAAVTATLLPPVSRLEAEVGPSEITVHWAAHPAAQEVRVTRSSPGAPLTQVAVTGNSCRLTGLPEGQVQHFEVTAVYHGLNGAELLSATAQINATPMSEAEPIPRLRAQLVEVGRCGPGARVLEARRPLRGSHHAFRRPAELAVRDVGQAGGDGQVRPGGVRAADPPRVPRRPSRPSCRPECITSRRSRSAVPAS